MRNIVNMTDDVLHLEVWKGNWDLPSVDHECLTVWVRFISNHNLFPMKF